MKWGTALVTDVVPKRLEDYDHLSVESLVADRDNLSVAHDSVIELRVSRGDPSRGQAEFFWLSMSRRPVPVHNFTMKYRDHTSSNDREIRFYLVPLGMYFKPRRMTQTRETILREYARDAAEIFQAVLPARVISNSIH